MSTHPDGQLNDCDATNYGAAPPVSTDDGATRYSDAPADPHATAYTPTAETPNPAAGRLPRRFGGYELLAELGHGGMGVVYRAKEFTPERLVALKLIRSGELADAEDVRRFRQEADEAARLDHPHITPVYEVGEQGGLHFFTMKLVEGGSLSQHLERYHNDPKAAAQVTAVAARAVHYAHQRQLLHRDLKPGNILLDAAGQPHVADFGLAKRMEEGDACVTRSNAVVGTPEYMAPEQARGEKRLTTAADVYALGGVLYALLTGNPPFRGDSSWATMDKVLSEEPTPPSKQRPGVPRDLETICLKCLQKEPAKRYGSAEALAEDLERWLRGEPIWGRPVGRMERAWMWCRRNPAAAVLSTAFVIALLLGAGVSTYFGLDAREQANQTNIALGKVTDREKQVSQTNAKLEETLAQSLLRPMNDSRWDKLNITRAEVESLWELAQSGERVRLLFIEKALGRPTTIRQLRNRADLLIPAVLRLDPSKKGRVEQLLLERLRDDGLGLRARADLLSVGLTLGEPSAEFTAAAAPLVLRQIDEANDEETLDSLADTVKALAPALQPEARDAAVQGVLRAAIRTGNRDASFHQTEIVQGLASQLGPEAARGVVRLALDALAQSKREEYTGALGMMLAETAPRLNPRVRVRAADVQLVVEAMNRTAYPQNHEALARSAAALADRLDPPETAAATAAGLTINAMDGTINGVAPEYYGKLMEALAAKMNAAQALAAGRQAQDAMRKSTNRFGLSSLAFAAAALAARLDRPHAEIEGRVALRLVDEAMTSGGNEYELDALAGGAAALEGVLDRQEASARAQETAQSVLNAVAKANAWNAPTRGMTALAVRLDAGGAATVARQALEAARANPASARYYAGAAGQMTGRLGPKEAAALLPSALDLMGKATESGAVQPLAELAKALAVRLDAETAAAVRPFVDKAMANSEYIDTTTLLAETLAIVLTREGAGEDKEIAAQVAQAAAKGLAEATDRNRLIYLTRILAAFAPRLEAGRAAADCGTAARALRKALGEANDVTALPDLAAALATLAPWLDAAEAEASARAVLDALKKTNDFRLTEALTALAARLDPAGPAPRLLMDALGREHRAFHDAHFYEAMPALLARFSDEDAAAVVRVILDGSDGIAMFEGPLRNQVAALLVRAAPEEVRRYAARTAGAVGAAGLWGRLASLASAPQPLAGRFTEQQLVDLLKLPTCPPPVRQVIVRQVGAQCGQTFANEWQFVDWAREHRPDLDLTSPPVRPERP